MTEIVKIYKLSNLTKFVYIGSTIKNLNIRLSEHKCHLKIYSEDRKISYCRSFEILAFGNYKIELIETCSKKDRYKQEGWWVKNTPNTVNKLTPGRTKIENDAEWRQNHKEEIKEYSIKYYQKHKKEKNKKYTCECRGTHSHQNKSQHVKTKKHQDWLHTNP